LHKAQFYAVDIDDEFRRREFDWNVIGPRLSQLHGLPVSEAHIVVDVGAGTQTLPELYTFLQQAKALVVVVTAPPEEVILRQPIWNRDPAEFLRTEYTARTTLFGLATLTIDVAGLASEDAAQKVVDQINRLLAKAS
jgi:hypothetical protein